MRQNAKNPANAVVRRGSDCISLAACSLTPTGTKAAVQALTARSGPDLAVVVDALQAMLDDQQAILDTLRAAVQPAAGKPLAHSLVSLKVAAHQFGVHERTMRRHAKAGAGVKAFGRWKIDTSRIALGGAR